jgi:hypothetical protein
MSTPDSGLTPYCTPARFLQAYDVRTIADLLSDDGQRLTPANVASSPILAVLLAEASGWFESVCFTADRYSEADIYGVINQAGNGASMIAGLVAGITMWMCFDRRPDKASKYELPAKAQLAMEMLDRLRKGERILPIAENGAAGLPASFVLSPSMVFQQNLSTTQARRYFGQRDNQVSPPSFGG